jgi:signal transduction histidine kinase
MSTEDITERKRNEIALTRSFDLVSDQNKRLLNFSYIVSHNLRSHTSNIKSILGLLPYADSDTERNKMIELLSIASNSLNETIHNLNDVISVQANLNLVTEPIKLKEAIDKTTVVLGEQIALKKAEIRIQVDTQLTVNYNPAYLESILFNFISNAIKYSHPDRIPVITISCRYQDERWILEVADNGIGIDLQKNGDQLFGMYKTFNGNADARGIGLFISKNQIEAMGGSVEIESELNRGTTFRIYIK